MVLFFVKVKEMKNAGNSFVMKPFPAPKIKSRR